MECFVATHDPVMKAAAGIAGFADVRVTDTPQGRMVLTRHRFGHEWMPYERLAPGQCAYDAFYGTAFWERSDVLGMYQRQEDQKARGREGVLEDVRGDFRRQLQRQMGKRVDGKSDLIEALARMGRLR